MLKNELKSIDNAISLIRNGQCKRVDLGSDTIVYKVPSNNPNKYTIRMDIKIDNTKEE